MSISDELTILSNTKDAIRGAIENTGMEVTSNSFASYATTINQIPERVAKTGDTMTGSLEITLPHDAEHANNLTLKNTGITRGTTPSASTTFNGIEFLDSQDNYFGRIYSRYGDSGAIELALQVTGATGNNSYLRIGRSATDVPYITWHNNDINPYYRAGDTFASVIDVGAFLSSSKTTIFFSIPTPKYLTNINTITVNTLKVSLRRPDGGYVPSSNWDAKTNATVSVSKDTSASMINVEIVSSSAYSSFTNNICLCGAIDFSFSFS